MEEKMKQIMADLSAGKITQAQAAEQCAALMKPAPPRKPLTMDISPTTGVLCLRGLQRWPISLYATQWQRLIEDIDVVKNFLVENKDKIKWER